MLSDNLIWLWAGLTAGALTCLASTGRRFFGAAASGAAGGLAAAAAGLDGESQGLVFAALLAGAALIRAARPILKKGPRERKRRRR